MNYCRSLSFDQKPNYRYLRGLFRHVLAKNVEIRLGSHAELGERRALRLDGPLHPQEHVVSARDGEGIGRESAAGSAVPRASDLPRDVQRRWERRGTVRRRGVQDAVCDAG